MVRRFSLWSPFVRFAGFWAIVSGVMIALAFLWPWFQPRLILKGSADALSGHLETIGTEAFAFALASGIASFAIALFVAFGVFHVLAIYLSLKAARHRVERTATMAAFAKSYELIHRNLERHPLIGHAWREFDETLVKPAEPGQPICNTVRPQAFLNFTVAREKLFGLKIMGSIPGYFVGAGLLLTFIGLVLALHKAAAGVNATDASAMQSATRELLQVATFKFATSIAGLGASILLSLAFRAYAIWMERAFDNFCRAVESKLKYIAPQSIAAEMNERMGQQVAELKSINSEAFFARMGEAISPGIEGALSTAMLPVAAGIENAVAKLAHNSQSGITSLIDRFTHSVQGAAGTELKELGAALGQMQVSLGEMQQSLQRTGEAFSGRLTAAAEGLERLLASAGERIKGSQEQAAEHIASAAAQAAEGLRRGLDDFVERFSNEVRAAAGAELKELGAALGQMQISLTGIQSSLQNTGEDFSERLTTSAKMLEGRITAAGERASSAQNEASRHIAEAAAQAAEGMKQGLAEVVEQLRAGMGAFSNSMRDCQAAIGAEARAIAETTARTREAGESFSRAAQDVRLAAAPFAQSGERMARASEAMRDSIKESAASLASSQAASKELAQKLALHSDHLLKLWEGYAGRFDKIDRELAGTIKTIADTTQGQSEALLKYARQIDHDFANAIDKLNPLLSGLYENSEAFADSVGSLKNVLAQEAAE